MVRLVSRREMQKSDANLEAFAIHAGLETLDGPHVGGMLSAKCKIRKV